MTRVIIVLLSAVLLVPSIAHARKLTEKREHYCLILGGAFKMAAGYRDTGLPPRKAYGILLGFKSTLGKQKIKKVVNLVYFDPRFAGAGGYPLMTQVYNSCRGVAPHYKPLK